MKRLTVGVVCGIALTLSGCASKVVWKDRVAPEPGQKEAVTPVPTCTHCEQYADWESDSCKNPKCGKTYQWYEPELLN